MRKFNLILIALFTGIVLNAQKKNTAEIHWDTWGVPHISGKTNKEAFYALGWAQMKAHGDLILKSFGKSRGRSAEYWGGDQNLQSDILIHQLEIPERAKKWYALQSSEMKTIITSFVAGMNAYCETHAEKINDELEIVLPIQNTDPIAKLQVSYHFMVGAFAMQPQAAKWKTAGSNAWAIGPKKSESGNAMLLTQPHPPWFEDYLFFEFHIKSDKVNFYGISIPGSPTIAMGFNENLGWALTFNQADTMDLIEIELFGDKYNVKEEIKSLESKEIILKIKNKDKFQTKKIKAQKSDFGYVIETKNNKALALRLSGLDRPFFGQQFYDMARAKNLNQFESALKKLQLPLQNIIYADKKGDIFYMYNGIIPKRSEGTLAEWSKIISSEKDGALVKEYVNYDVLPKFKNPTSGFIANSNNGPWSSTYPFLSVPENFPEYITARRFRYLGPRGRGSIKMLLSKEKISFDEVIKMQGSTHAELADRALEGLITFGEKSDNPLLKESASVLKNWDRNLETDSKGAVLFKNWYDLTNRRERFEVRFSPEDALHTPNTVSEKSKNLLLKAAEITKSKYGKLNVSFGEVYKTNYAGKFLDGGLGLSELGSFNAGFYRPMSDKKYTLLGGSAFTSVVEFGKKIKAKGILSYGNTSQKDSPFLGNQLELMLNRKLRDIWFYENDINKNLFLKETLIIKNN